MDYTELKDILNDCKVGLIFDVNDIPVKSIIFLPNGEIKICGIYNDIKLKFQNKQDKIDTLERDNKQLYEKIEELKSNLEYFEISQQQIVTELNYNIDEITTSRETISKLNTTLADVLMKYANLLDKMIEVNKHD